MSTLSKVIEVVSQETGRPEEQLSAETSLESLGLDSLEFVCLMQAVSNSIHEIPDVEWVRINTIGDIAAACEYEA